MLENRLGVISDEVSDRFVEALDWIQSQGLSFVEVRMVDGVNIADVDDREVDRMAAEISSRGLRVSGVASPLFKCALDSTREVASGDRFGSAETTPEEHLARLPSVIGKAQKLGTNYIRVFSFWREKQPELYFDDVVFRLKEAASIAGQHGATLLLENEFSCNGGTAEEAARIAGAVDSPWLKIVWDPGNEAATGRSAFPEGYEFVKPWVAHVHLKDAREADGGMTIVPIGRGKVAWAEQFLALERDGYQGLFIIETHYKPEGGTKMEGTGQSLEGLRRLLR